MEKKIYLSVFFLIITRYCFGWANPQQQILNDSIKTHFKKLYIVLSDDRPPIATASAFIDPQRTISMEPLPDSSSWEIRHLLKIDYILVLKIMPKTKILTLNNIFDLYKIQSKDRKLPVKVDYETVEYPETILVSQNQIDNIKIVKGRKGNFINIILKGYYEIKEEEKKGVIKRVL